ncbi:MAG: LptF/LptG family permease [Saprospiraceae bacterium]|nr:LptF/LptG family permease [Saprospiraceae bacterium]
MKKIDYYIIKKFLGTFFFSISLILVIVIVFDISEKIDDFIEKGAPLKAIVFDYYLNFIPYFVNLFSPLFTFIAVILFTAKIAANSEIVAILSSGISFNRLLRPYLISSLFLAFMTFYLANFLIPHSNIKRLAFEEAYIKNPYRNVHRNIHIQTKPGEFIYVESFNVLTNVAQKFTLERIDPNGLIFKLSAETMQWDTVTNEWRLNQYFMRTIDGLEEKISNGFVKDTVLNFTPDIFVVKIKNVDIMNYSQLRTFIAEEKLKGSKNVEFYQVEKHKRISFPFALIVLTIIGVALSSRKIRGGIGLHLAIGIIISFAYILFMRISTTFATYGDLSPFLAVWIPNIIFIALGIYLLRNAPK